MTVSSDKFDNQNKNTKDICEELAKGTKEFDKIVVINIINNNIKNGDRFLYSEISNYVFRLNNTGIMHSNIEALVDYVFDDLNTITINKDTHW